MRKCAAVFCAVLVTVGVCSCGKKTEPQRKSMADPTVMTTTTTMPTVDYTEEPGKTPLKMTYATSFSDGVAFVTYLAEDGTTRNAAINTAGDVLFEMPTEMPLKGPGYKDGIRVVNNIIYDKTGAVIASPELSGYDSLLTGSCGGYVLAKREEAPSLPAPMPETSDSTTIPTSTTTAASTTTTGGETTTTTLPEMPPVTTTATVYVGVLNNKGEWVQELSADHPVAKVFADTTTFRYVKEDVLEVSTATGVQYYHFSDNTLTADYVRYVSVGQQGEGESIGIYQMAADGTKTLKIENVMGDYFFDTVFIGRTVTIPLEPGADPVVGDSKLYDYEGNELMDLAQYPLREPSAYYVWDHLMLLTTDAMGSRLLVVLNKDGQLVFEPLMLGMRDAYYPPDESGFVVESYTADGVASYRHYDYTGNVTEYSDVTSFGGFVGGLAVVTLRGDTQQYYYINHRAEIVLR